MIKEKFIEIASFNLKNEEILLKRRNTDIVGSESYEKTNAADHLVPFLIELLEIPETNLTKSISNSIIDLDQLAKQIDKVIDINGLNYIGQFSYSSFKELENKIVDCFSYLKGTTELQNLVEETLTCVNLSFKYNTSERHLIYNLSTTNFNCCTTYYLLPLVQYLFKQSRLKKECERLFLLISNYIQLIDDYVDLFDDIESNIKTPITHRIDQINMGQGVGNKMDLSTFNSITKEFKECLFRNYNEIYLESRKINYNLEPKLFEKWRLFLYNLSLVELPHKSEEESFKDYILIVRKLVPPIICYEG